MSARQPFVPSRTASRAAHVGDSTQHTQDFVADASNPLHRHSVLSATNKPLNIAGLLKRNDSQPARSAQLPQTPRKSSEDITRPRTANTLEYTLHSTGTNRRPSLQIIAPTPSHLPPNTPPTLLSVDDPAFKAPALPSASNKPTSRSPLDLSAIDTHIHGSVTGTDSSLHGFSGSEARAPDVFTSLGSDSVSKAPSQYSGAEKIVQSTDKIQHGDSEGFSHPNEGGPVRVYLNSRPRISDRRRRLGSKSEAYLANEHEDASDGCVSSVRRQKRNRAERLDDDSGDDDHATKRGKYETEPMDEASWKEYAPIPVRRSSYHHHVANLDGEMQPSHSTQAYPQLSRQHNHSGSTLPVSPTSNHEKSPWSQRNPYESPQFGDHGQQPQQHQPKPVPELILQRVLGEDTEAYIAEQFEAHEKAQKRWEEATIEEWLSGADELAESFGRMLDFVKDHIITKIKLHTTLEKKLDAHGLVLEGQEKTLTQVKKDLIKNGGSLLGGT